MATINEQFIQVKTKASFESRLSAGDVKDTSIAFIEDTNEIWAKGKYYQAVPVNKGTTNQVLTKTDSGCDWLTPQTGDVFPEGGTTGQVLTKTDDGIAWQDASDPLPSDGTVGQVLTKTSDGAEWATHDLSVSQATDTTLGTVKIGYTQNQGNYPVVLDGDGKAYVPVNLTYEEASGTSGELDIASMVILTQQQYDDLETKNQNTIYFIRG